MTTIRSASYKQQQAQAQSGQGEAPLPHFVPDFGASDLDGIVAGIGLLQPTTKYRETTVGKLLIESLNELLTERKITQTLYEKTVRQFDRTILTALTQRLSARVAFKAARLNTYKYIDNEWTFILDHVEFREFHSFAYVPKLKIMAIEGRCPGTLKLPGTKKRWKRVDNQSAPNGL